MVPICGIGQDQKLKCGISQVLREEGLFGLAKTHELFLGWSLMQNAK